MQIKRTYNLNKLIAPKRILIIYGPRRVGKTTLIKEYLKTTKDRYLFAIGDSLPFQNLLASLDPQLYNDHFQDYQSVIIDEAQYIPNVGRSLKLLIDLMPHLKIVVTGSSSFELAGQVGEPLTGRKWELMLYPVSYYELAKQMTKHDLMMDLKYHLVYGLYPEVLTAKTLKLKRAILQELTASYLFKDILALENLKSPQILVKLLRLLAFQVGNQVSLVEIGSQLGINYKTVARYIDLLKKSFIIFELSGFSRNLRNEVAKKKKYYFIDLGIRNAIIDRFQDIDLRDDVGYLWENFLIIEYLKKQTYSKNYHSFYFWRTWEKQEIDLIEEKKSRLYAFEFKWSMTKKVKPPRLFKQTYPQADFKVINPRNYLKLIT